MGRFSLALIKKLWNPFKMSKCSLDPKMFFISKQYLYTFCLYYGDFPTTCVCLYGSIEHGDWPKSFSETIKLAVILYNFYVCFFTISETENGTWSAGVRMVEEPSWRGPAQSVFVQCDQQWTFRERRRQETRTRRNWSDCLQVRKQCNIIITTVCNVSTVFFIAVKLSIASPQQLLLTYLISIDSDKKNNGKE